MEKINFVNNTTPALNATNLNKLQDNVEDAIDESETTLGGEISTLQSDVSALQMGVSAKLDKTSVKTTTTSSSTDTYSCNYINNLVDYSESEKVIGKWTNGKPLYRKVIIDTMGTSNAAWKSINVFSANEVSKVVKMVGTFTYANGSIVPIPFVRTTDSSYSNREYVFINFDPSNGNVGVIGYHGNSYQDYMAGRPIIIVMEYTKTAD